MNAKYLLKQARKNPESFKIRAKRIREACKYADVDRSEAPRLLADQYLQENRPQRGYISERVLGGLIGAAAWGTAGYAIYRGMTMGAPSFEKYALEVGKILLLASPLIFLGKHRIRMSKLDYHDVIRTGEANKALTEGETHYGHEPIRVNLESI